MQTIKDNALRFASLTLLSSFLVTACAVDPTEGSGAPQGNTPTPPTAGAQPGAVEPASGVHVDSLPRPVDCATQGLAYCDGACVDLLTDNNNCGTCGNVCKSFVVRHTFIRVWCSDGACI